jgi:hypothetical protein
MRLNVFCKQNLTDNVSKTNVFDVNFTNTQLIVLQLLTKNL